MGGCLVGGKMKDGCDDADESAVLGGVGSVVGGWWGAGGDVEGSDGGFSSSGRTGEGEGAACALVDAGVHCRAVFFSTSTTRKMMSRTIKPNAM